MQYTRMPIEIESPESLGYATIACNLAESSVRDFSFRETGISLDELVIAYGDHLGKPALRELIAGFYSGITSNDVLLTIGAAGALFIIHSALLKPTDHLIVVRPNYATNIETPRAIGCDIDFIDLAFEENFAMDVQKIAAAVRSNTKLISITTPHNPTGTRVNREAMDALCRLAAANNCLLLVDETYRDLSFDSPFPLAAAMSSQAISVSSVSKAYGIPGIRIGWIITRDPQLQHLFLAAKEQIHISNSVVDEEICHQFLRKKHLFLPAIRQMVDGNFNALKKWMTGHPDLEWVEPAGGVVCFPRFKNFRAVDPDRFYTILLEKYKTYVGPGHWFEQPRHYFRLGFGWEQPAAFAAGLENIDRAIGDSRQ